MYRNLLSEDVKDTSNVSDVENFFREFIKKHHTFPLEKPQNKIPEKILILSEKSGNRTTKGIKQDYINKYYKCVFRTPQKFIIDIQTGYKDNKSDYCLCNILTRHKLSNKGESKNLKYRGDFESLIQQIKYFIVMKIAEIVHLKTGHDKYTLDLFTDPNNPFSFEQLKYERERIIAGYVLKELREKVKSMEMSVGGKITTIIYGNINKKFYEVTLVTKGLNNISQNTIVFRRLILSDSEYHNMKKECFSEALNFLL